MNNSSVGDLAAQIMAGQDPAPQPAPIGLPENSTDPLIVETQSSMDISQVEVSDDLMDQILGTTSTPAPVVEEVAPVVDEELKEFIEEEDVQEEKDLLTLVQEVKALLVDVKGVLTEMTTVGAIGVNMGAGPGKKKKDPDTEPEAKDKKKDAMKALLKKIQARKST